MKLDDHLSYELEPVSVAEAGQRLDKFLSARLPDLSRTRLKGLMDDELVFENDQPVQNASAKVKAGQSYSVCVPPEIPAEPEPQNIPLAVIYEDEHLIVIDKPAGMVVHPAAGSPDGTLVNALLYHCGESLSGIGGVKRPGIVHRIDKDTSGLLVIAKNDQTHHGLSQQFATHNLERAYKALVWGLPTPLSGSVESQIARSTDDRKKMAVVKGGGKYALTHYKVIHAYFQGFVSLVECRLATGRTHQIRVHMTSLGHPLVGDQTYGRSRSVKSKSIPIEAGTALKTFPRQALHAYLLGFTHPITGEKLRFESDMPYDINTLLKFLDHL